MKKSQKDSVNIILSILVVGVLVVGGYFIFIKKSLPKTEVPIAKTTTERESPIYENMKRLLPSDFIQLPKGVVTELEIRGCTIPQASYWGYQNVINGQFMKKGQIDWAVLCSKNDTSSILVFWDGSVNNMSEIASSPDEIFFTGSGYSRGIGIADKEFIVNHGWLPGNYGLSLIDHDGIDDKYLGKASSIHYYYNGQWKELEGSD